MSTRYIVVIQAPSGAEEGPLRIFGPWRSKAAADSFADAVNRKTDAAFEKSLAEGSDHDVMYHRAGVMLLRPHRLQGPGGAYAWALEGQ